METTTTTNTITSQYGIGEGAEISLVHVMGVTEASHNGISWCYSTKPGEANTITLNMDFSLNNRLSIFF